MKLKEKLAKEYAEKRFNEFGSFTDQETAYLAGFEKAREMAKANMFKHLQNKELDWQTCVDLIWCDLNKLGEEEIS